jgi:TrmH family RNA methyltransferase
MPSIILISPESSGNVGSICRVMRNFEFEKLILIDPKCDIYNTESKMMALEHYDIILNACIYLSIEQVVEEFDYIIAFSRRKGSKRQSNGVFNEFLKTLSEREFDIEKKKTAFVFGRESSGLTKEEIMQCSFVVELFTSKEKGSMNLSHAVALGCYEHYKFINRNDKQAINGDVNNTSTINRQANEIWSHLDKLLKEISFYGIDSEENTKYRISSILKKTFINELDEKYLIKVIEKLKRLFKYKR